MSALEQLAAMAVRGTEREAGGLPRLPGAAGELLAALDPADREGSLLAAAGALSLWRQAGRPLARITAEMPSPAPPESLQECSQAAGSMLGGMLAGPRKELLPEWLALAAASGARVPHSLLPGLLEFGGGAADLRTAIVRVLGERGRWLAGQNPAWRWVIAAETADEAVWETGAPSERAAYLRAVRRRDADAARELLAKAWPNEPAKERRSLLGALEAGLSMADEPFLEAALDDRSVEVREHAAELLCRVPGSALVRRMLARAEACLRFRSGLLGTKLDVTLPAALDPADPAAAARDGVRIKPPAQSGGVGEKAWWLQQYVAAVPPRHWCRAWGRQPAQLLPVIAKCEFGAVLLNALATASVRHADADWAETLLASGALQPADHGHLARVLPASRRQALALRLLRDDGGRLDPNRLPQTLLSCCDEAWSAELTLAVLDAIWRAVSPKSAARYDLYALIRQAAGCADPQVGGPIAAKWVADPDVAQRLPPAARELPDTLEFRTRMRAEFA